MLIGMYSIDPSPPPSRPFFCVMAHPNSHKKPVRALCYCSNNRYPSSWTSPEVKELFQGPPSSPNYSCTTTAPAGSCLTTQTRLSNVTIAGLVLGCFGVFLLILTATLCAFCVKRKKSPPDDDDGKGIICVGVKELAAEQALQEIMTERKDLAELSA